MPELPEVETIRRGLISGSDGVPSLVHQRITSVDLFWPKAVASPDPLQFIQGLQQREIVNLSRRGKFLLINLDHGTLIFHLRMSGDLRMQPAGEPTQKHDRLQLNFNSGWKLVFNDTRKFGRAWLTEDPQKVLSGIGPEPLDSDLTPDKFYAMLQVRSRQIKPLLMDQRFLAGLGNIYTDEALFSAGIHPLRRSDTLTQPEAERLLTAIREVLQQGILPKGASIDWVYRGGDFQNHFQVYKRTGSPCPRCGTPIQRIVVGQRSTHFCPVCQPQGGSHV
ncbi:MAG TPA: bifunctional DNA-formamidopyrimidine glycosylase/DNA-(apurinic or apyrimidinic site) lyase [Anaerolineaceae bacterium]|nr:bifunctional DNA-formamidopyrimidine glycosylase/DNA-(apurinic or apyrimidinic site) lyase [Anaerolineaceae bacterium]